MHKGINCIVLNKKLILGILERKNQMKVLERMTEGAAIGTLVTFISPVSGVALTIAARTAVTTTEMGCAIGTLTGAGVGGAAGFAEEVRS